MEQYQTILTEFSNQVLLVTMNRIERHNALNSVLNHELGEAISDASNQDVNAIVITGAGEKAFCAGGDMLEMSGIEATDTGLPPQAERLNGITELGKTPIPTIAAVNGNCYGGGARLAIGCDIRIASSTAIFGMPEVKVGLPSVIEAALLPRLVGWGKASYLVMTGENIDAAKAYDWGFLEVVARPEELKKETVRVAASIANSGPIAVRAQKRLMTQWERLSIKDGIHSGIEVFSEAYESDEPQIMMEPFLKRK